MLQIERERERTRSEIVDDVESLSDLLRGLALDHRRDFGAGQIQQRLDVHVVCSLCKYEV